MPKPKKHLSKSNNGKGINGSKHRKGDPNQSLTKNGKLKIKLHTPTRRSGPPKFEDVKLTLGNPGRFDVVTYLVEFGEEYSKEFSLGPHSTLVVDLTIEDIPGLDLTITKPIDAPLIVWGEVETS